MMSIIPVILTANDAQEFVASFTVVRLEDFSLALKNISRILHPHEMDYFNNLKYESRRKSYLMGRYACKKVLCTYLNEPNLTAIEMVHGIFGQPVVRYFTREMPGVSLSHNNSFAVAIAFPDTLPMALDIETADISKVKVIKSQLTKSEVNIVMSGFLPEYLLCTILWTAKEALSKLIKCGLIVRFTLFEAEIIENNNRTNEFNIKFSNFPQYQVRAWILGNTVLAIVYPVKTELDLIYEDVKNCLSNGLR